MMKLPFRRIIDPRSLGQIRFVASTTATDAWPIKRSESAPKSEGSVSDALADTVDSSPVQGASNSVKPETLVSFIPNSIYNPQDFLRSRRTASDPRRLSQPSVGPDAKTSLEHDTFRYLEISPLREANNKALLRNFMTGMAKILPRSKTNLSWRSQRMVARAIKRAKQKGILSVTSNPDWHKKSL